MRDAIDAYCAERKDTLDQRALNLLARLANSSDAAKAFERLKLKDRREEAKVLTTFIQAEDLARTFPQRITKAKMTLVRLERHGRAVAGLRTFVDELIAQQKNPPAFDLLSARILEPPANIVAMKRGLDHIADRIEAGRRVAKEDVLRLGATRKSQIKRAGQNAAIGWLGEGVRRTTGKPHLPVVADLAQVTIGAEVSVDRVRHAVRTRKREWRQPL